jgi:hypothetical protein
MNIFSRLKRKKMSVDREEYLKYKKFESVKVQNLIQGQRDIHYISHLTIGTNENDFNWHRHLDYASQTALIHSLYMLHEYHGGFMGTIIDKRAAFVAGGGIEIKGLGENNERDIAFAKEFLKYNQLNKAGFIKMQADIDKEGKCLFRLVVDHDYEWSWDDNGTRRQEKKMVAIQYFSWAKYQYVITPDPICKRKAIAATIIDANRQPLIINKPGEIVYRKYRGMPNDINSAISIFARAIPHVIAMEKCYTDLRYNDHLFAAPITVTECDTAEALENTIEALEKISEPIPGGQGDSGVNAKSGGSFAIQGHMKYLTPEEQKNLESEIDKHRIQIAAIIGLPVHFLGDSSQVKNKNVSENLMENTNTDIYGDRETTTEIMTEAVQKAMILLSGERTPYNHNEIELNVGGITAADYNRLVAFWLPAIEAGKVSLQTFIEQIPGIDPDEELLRLENEKEDNGDSDTFSPITNQIIDENITGGENE